MSLLCVLRQLRSRAMRKRVWYRLSPLDRAFAILVLRMVETVISEYLRSRLAIVVMRLEELLNPVMVLTEVLGKKLAKQIVETALSWGYKNAKSWLTDQAFLRYLTIMEMNRI